MSKIALMVSRDSVDAPLARTFGKAKWLVVWDDDQGFVFHRNGQLSGGSVAGAIAASGCRDVIASHLGEKACGHLRSLGIRIWKGPADSPIRDVVEMHLRGELEAWDARGGGCTSPGAAHGRHAHAGSEGQAPAVVQLRRRPGAP
jgi:predicted Fe-Mo cluster-binding NifX family protein